MTGNRVGSPSSENISEYSYSKEQERFLPIANVGRIMKKSLPSNAKVSKEAKETVQECVSEFISFVTGEASDKCQREKRKTINGDDLLWAMTTLGFENYVGLLKIYLNKYRETEGEKKSMAIQEEQPLPNTTNSINDNHDLHGSNHDYYALGAQVTKQSYGDLGYGDKLVISSGFNIHELGDGNAKRAMAAHFHHGGVEW